MPVYHRKICSYKGIKWLRSSSPLNEPPPPPVKTSITAKRYKGLIDHCVPSKRNDSFKKVLLDFHYASFQISLVNQLGTLYSKNTLMIG